jgi:hypothetical protein
MSGREELERKVAGTLGMWGFRSRHPEWSDKEACDHLAAAVLDAIAPDLAAMRAEVLAEVERRIDWLRPDAAASPTSYRAGRDDAAYVVHEYAAEIGADR